MSNSWVPSAHGRERGGIQKRVARGLLWTLLDSWGGQVLGLLIFAILANLLQPVDFGLVALAVVFISFGQLIVDQGLGDAIVQRRELTRRQIDTAFWTAVATGMVLFVVGLVVAGPIARLLGEPRLEQVLQALSLNFVVVAFNSIQVALLRRELNFRTLAIRRLLAIGFGGAVGVAMAVGGFGAWALVGQMLAQSAMAVAVLWTTSPWRPGLSFSGPDFRSMFGFGLNVVGSDLLSFLSRNMDNLLIGVFLGAEPLGFYAVAYRLLDTSQTVLIAAARRVVFPGFARLQHDMARVRRAYIRLARASSALTLPGYIGLALVAREAIVVIFGQKWEPSADAAAILFLIGPVLTLQAFSGAVWNAVGHPEVTLRYRLLSTILNVGGFVVAVLAFRDITAVAAAFVIRGYLLLPLNLYLMARYGAVTVRDQIMRLRGVAIATAVMAVAVLGIKAVLGSQLPPAPLLALEVGVGVVVYAVALLVVERPLIVETLTVAVQVVPGAGKIARRLGWQPKSKDGRRKQVVPRAEPAPITPPVADELGD